MYENARGGPFMGQYIPNSRRRKGHYRPRGGLSCGRQRGRSRQLRGLEKGTYRSVNQRERARRALRPIKKRERGLPGALGTSSGPRSFWRRKPDISLSLSGEELLSCGNSRARPLVQRHQALAHGVFDKLGAVMQVKLFHDLVAMSQHRL